jgi:4-hydroxy-tetrahydrodipicolinate reductase
LKIVAQTDAMRIDAGQWLAIGGPEYLPFSRPAGAANQIESKGETNMTDQHPLAIAVTGVSGRMGQMLVQAIAERDDTVLAGATERSGHPWVGRDLGEAMGGAANGITVSDDPLEVFAGVRAVLDFTTPEATVTHADIAAQARLVHVIGTTGLADADLTRLCAAARHATVIRAGNMSLGVNLLTVLTRKVAEALDPDFDIEIVETHHHHKVDAPSGTALMLGEAAAEGRGEDLSEVADRGRDGHTGARKRGDIGFAALRGGDVVGEHDVIFAGMGERIVLRHIAADRMIFARGAVKAALWGQNRKPGEYSMIDVLGLG